MSAKRTTEQAEWGAGAGSGDGGQLALWRRAMGAGIDRRRFLQLLLAGGAAAVLAACERKGIPDAAPARKDAGAAPASTPAEGSPWLKDTEPFIVHGSKSLEAKLANMEGLLTPTKYFFVRNNSVSLDLDAADWSLTVEGDAVTAPLTLSYDDVRNLPRRVLVCYLECGGNHRAMFSRVQGQKASGTQWGAGGVSNGEWVGASLRDVLTLAGARDDAVSVLLVGLDTESPEAGFRRVIPIDKAMRPDTMLAYALNGDLLPPDHGYPVRALVPGWVGSSSIKWLGRIEVSTQQLWTRNNTTSYVLIGDDYPPEGEAEGVVANEQTIKSALALPWPAELSAGERRLHGFAHSPAGRIARVEWSDDGGAVWREADVLAPQPQRSWARFELVWRASPGERALMTRATDTAGNTQPDTVPFNAKGYLFNQPAPHPVTVA